jgi:hypothetical protein
MLPPSGPEEVFCTLGAWLHEITGHWMEHRKAADFFTVKQFYCVTTDIDKRRGSGANRDTGGTKVTLLAFIRIGL